MFWAAFGWPGAPFGSPGCPPGDQGIREASRSLGLTWPEWVDTLKQQHTRSNYADATVAALGYRLDRASRFLGRRRLSDITDDVLSDLNAHPRQGYGGQTPGLTMLAVQQALDEAVEAGHLASNPFRTRRLRARREGWLTKNTESEPRPLTMDELRTFLRAAEDDRDPVWRDWYMLAWLLCLRPAEVAGLTVEEFDGRWLRVWWQLSRTTPASPRGTEGEDFRWVVAPNGRRRLLKPPKGWPKNPAARRRVHLPVRALEVFVRWRRPEGGLLLLQRSGAPCITHTAQAAGARIAARAGLPWGREACVTSHSFRKTGSTLLADAKVREAVRAHIKGHSRRSLSQTERYAPATEAELVRAARVLDDVPLAERAEEVGA